MTNRGMKRNPGNESSTWTRRGMLTASTAAGLSALTGALTGCDKKNSGGSDDKLKEKVKHPSGNLKKKGFPIVKDPITVHFMTSHAPNTAKDYNKVANWEHYEKMTNVKVKWGPVQADSTEEKRNLALSGGDYPEAFYGHYMTVSDVGKYGRQGIFIKMNDLIDKYMPNLKKLLKENSDLRRGVTFPDDGIYALPLVIGPEFTAQRIGSKMWARNDWLDKFDMDVPKTTDEYYKYLKMVKTKQPNGKGETIPFGGYQEGDGLVQGLWGAFGVGNRGNGQDYLDVDPDDDKKVRFFPITDAYKALLEYLHKLYSEGLIAKNIFSIDESKAWDATKKGIYGSTVGIAPYSRAGGKAKHFAPMPALKGPDGDHAYNAVTTMLRNIGRCVLTDKCKHPVEMARWVDYFYSDEGAKLQFMGVKGKSYKETKGGVEYIDEITDPPHGKTQDEARKPYVTYQGGAYGPGIIKEDYFKGIESSDESLKATKVVEPDAKKVLKDGWTGFTFTQNESERLESLADDIGKYVDESRDKFITGELKLSNWHKYVNKIKKMGLDDYMELQQSAYDRYRKS